MSQKLHVLRCYKCEVFQVHIVKKSNKWECKICGEKQSIKKIFGEGTGKECRIHVQKLNEMRANLIENNSETSIIQDKQSHEDTNQTIILDPTSSETSKWNKYLQPEYDEIDDANEKSDVKYVLELPNNKKRRCQDSNNFNRKSKKFHSLNDEPINETPSNDCKILNNTVYSSGFTKSANKNLHLTKEYLQTDVKTSNTQNICNKNNFKGILSSKSKWNTYLEPSKEDYETNDYKKGDVNNDKISTNEIASNSQIKRIFESCDDNLDDIFNI